MFAISLIANWLNMNSAYYYVFRTLSIIQVVYIVEIQKLKFANIYIHEFDH